MTETEEPAAEAMTAEVPFKGRTLHMNMPTPEQILVWRRTVKRFEGLDATQISTAAEALDAVDRCVRIVTSLFALRKDVDWLDDEMLEKNVTFGDVIILFGNTVESFGAMAREASGADDNRESRRAAAKATPKKVTRKRPAKATDSRGAKVPR
jgi:hypothetical protein